MAWIPSGEFAMGSHADRARPDEQPVHRVRLNGFWMETTEVTNAQFRQFVEATGYVTTAEQAPPLIAIMAQLPPGTPPPPSVMLVPGSLVFTFPSGSHPTVGWAWQPGANWRQPQGPSSAPGRNSAHGQLHV